jgi:hypothetical protein
MGMGIEQLVESALIPVHHDHVPIAVGAGSTFYRCVRRYGIRTGIRFVVVIE